MTCDYVDRNHHRCGDDEVIERVVFHSNHDEYVGTPSSPYILHLCEDHKNARVNWSMIVENDRILTNPYQTSERSRSE